MRNIRDKYLFQPLLHCPMVWKRPLKNKKEDRKRNEHTQTHVIYTEFAVRVSGFNKRSDKDT
jgi:hypothetical protein